MGALALLAASACLSAPVTYALPSDPGAPAGVPWVRAGAVYGYLFYYGADGPWKTQRSRVLITTRGGVPGGYATKILWHVRDGSSVVTVSGRRLDGPGRFRQRFPATSTGGGGGWFPSIGRPVERMLAADGDERARERQVRLLGHAAVVGVALKPGRAPLRARRTPLTAAPLRARVRLSRSGCALRAAR